MGALSQMEKWVRSGLSDYRDQLHIFQNSNKQLIRMAEQKNLDGAALAYVQMTLSCVNCHKVVRSSREVQPMPNERQWAAAAQPTCMGVEPGNHPRSSQNPREASELGSYRSALAIRTPRTYLWHSTQRSVTRL